MDRKTMTEEQARAVLREYPDADLSAFVIVTADGAELDENALAAEESERSLVRLSARAKGGA